MLKKMIMMLSTAALVVLTGFTNDNLEEVQKAMLAANEAVAGGSGVRAKSASVRLLSASSGGNSITYTATGDLDNVVGSGNLNFSFRVDKAFTEVTSATLEINAYDVDYPANNEHDKVYFNGSYIGRLKGVNGAYEVNTFSISPSLVRCPASEGQTVANTFSVAVNVDNGGWVTGVGWAKLTINGETFKLTASKDDSRGIMLKWNDVGDRYDVWRRMTVNGEWTRICNGLTTCVYLDKNVRYGYDYHYYVVADPSVPVKSSSSARLLSTASGDGARTPEETGYKGGTPTAPKIEKVELPRSGGWLRDNGPKKLKVTWNDYDKDCYSIHSVCYRLTKGTEKIDDVKSYSQWFQGSSEPFKEETVSFSKSVPFHGKCQLQIWVKYWAREGRDWRNEPNDWVLMHTESSLPVYFEKYGDSATKANWYKYWPEDGALSRGLRAILGKYDYMRIGDNPNEGGHVTKGCVGQKMKSRFPIVDKDTGIDRLKEGKSYSVVKNDGTEIGRITFLNGYPLITRSKMLLVEERVVTSLSAYRSGAIRPIFFHTSVGIDASGVESLAVTLHHEQKHILNGVDLYFTSSTSEYDVLNGVDLNRQSGNFGGIPLSGGRVMSESGKAFKNREAVLYQQTIMDAISNIRDNIKILQEGYVVIAEGNFRLDAANVAEYLSTYMTVLQTAHDEASEWCIDSDGDGIRDNTEESDKIKGASTLSDRADTWGVSMIPSERNIYSEYNKYGDDEIRARNAESTEGANKNNDWGFPGHKITVPEFKITIPSINMYWTIESQTWEDYSEGHWNSTYNGKNGDADVPLFVPKTYLTSMCFEEFKSDETRNPLSPSTTRTKMHMSASSTIATQIRSGNVNDVGEDVSTNGFYSSVILQNSNLSYNGQLLLSFVNSNLEYVPDPDNIFYDALTLHTDIVSCETNSVSAVVRSYLVDTNNLVCVEAEEKIELNPGTNSIELVFGGQHIYRQRSTGYKVGLVEVRSMEVYPNEVIATATNVASTVTLLSYSDFTPYKGVIVTKEAVGDLTESNLVFNVDVELNTQGAYTLVGELRDTNDVRVAHAIYTNLTYAGLQTIPLEFSREDIYLSGRPGPYKLTLLELRDADWELVDWIEKPVETDAFALAAMRPGCAALTVLSDSYSLNPLSFSADGFCDAVRLSLSVSNSLDSAIDCRVCVSVYSTNNEFVCRSYQAIEVSPGVNAYTLEVPGVEIAKSQIEGPYYIADILWEPMNGLPSERFVPEKELINVPRSSFGGSPFAVSGEAICRTGDVYKPIIVEVPIDVLRAGDISVSAIVTDTNGEFVVRSETNLVFSVGDDQKVAVEFSARDLISTGIAGPYVVSYLVLRSGYDGVEDVRIEEFKEVVDYTPILYVDAASGDDEADGLSVGTSKKTIQAALAWASDGAVINVGPGDYACPAEIDGETFLNIDKKVSIVATDDDPSKTRIVGQRGNSTNDVRGVYLVEGAMLAGFTITNFLMSTGGGVGVYGEGLGAIVSNCVIVGCSATHDGGGVYQCTVYDSTIQNCRAQNGGGAAQCNLIRCRIEGCTATRYGGGVAYGTADNCKIIRNTANYGGGGTAYATVLGSEISNNVQPTGNYGGGGAYQCSLSRCRIMENSSPSYYGGGVMQGTADNCVICGNSAQRGSGATAATLINCTVIGNRADVYGGGVYSGTLINSIVWGNTAPTSPNHYAGRGIYTCTTPLLDGDGNIDTDPVFRGAEFGGFMLSAGSSCLDAGIDNGGVAEYIYSGTTSTVMAAVSTLDFFGNERTQGAHVDMGAVEGVTNAWIVMTRTEGSGLLDVSFELVEPHSSLTITADESLRPLDRFEINDGRVFFGPQMQLDDISCDTFVTAYFRCYDFYVDAKNGNDANDGLSWGAAKKTIQAAIDCAVDGEKIWVAKGVYVPISMLDRRVEIEAVDGSSLTFIDGGGTNRCATLATSGSMASKTNSVLAGFTLMNGRSTQGGAAYGGTLRDCIIKSNKAEGSTYCYGGGTYYGMQVNCQYVGNAASATMYGYGGAAYYGTSYNCSYVDNSVYGPSNACGGAVYYGTHYDCVMTNNTSSSYGGASYYGTCHRTIVARNEAKWGGGCYGTSFYDGEIVRNTSSSHGGGVYYGSIYRSTIANNRSSGDGGGVYKASLTDCLVANNQALGGSGGGALLTDYTATRSSFVNNRARSNGGGVYGGTCTDCGITNNTATSNGGGAYNITATRTSIVGNNAVTGGGIYNGTYNSCILETNTSSGEGGGAYSGTFYDSLISNNQASGVGGGLRGCTFHRSRIIGNRSYADGGGVYNGTGYNSLIVQNKGLGNGGGVYGGYNYNCTITENWCGGSGGGISSGYHYNTIIWGNTNPDGSNNTSGGSFYSCRTASPSFVNPGEGDYRLRSGSPCINTGNNSYANGASDLALAARIQGGTVDMGAYEGGVTGLIVTIDSLGIGDLEYGSTIITNGGTFTVFAQSTGRAFLHFMTNGVIATTAPTLTLDGISSDVKITAEFVHEMFVDGAKGADGNSGFSWENAKKTIQAAIDESIEGDTIWVADGVYAPILARDKKIEIVSVNGPERTIIDGGGVSCCAWMGNENTFQFVNDTRLSGFTLRNGYTSHGGGVKYGRIDNCIVENCHATGHGGGVDYSIVSNCVIRNNTAEDYGGGAVGNTWIRFRDSKFVGNTARTMGGAVHMSGAGIFRNCEFVNNVAGSNGGALYGGTAYDSAFSRNRAVTGGAAYNGTFYRCALADNTATGDGGGAYGGTFYDSVISNNVASGAGGGMYGSTFHRSHVVCNRASGNGGGAYSGTGYNSIVAKNKTNANGGGTYSGYNYNCTIVENYCALSGGGTYSGYNYNSIVWNNRNAYGERNCEGGGSQYNCQTENPKFANATGCDYRLRAGSPCLNAGNNSYANGSQDVAGRTRVQDGTVDVGAYEGVVEGFVVNVVSLGGAAISHSPVVVESNGTFTVYAVNSARPFAGILTNGVLASLTVPFTLTGINSDVELTVDCAHDLYVDADNGDDGNAGFSRVAAKRSIQAAINVSVAGDVIHVADGYYAPFSSGNRSIRVKSDNGSDNCIVDGEYSERCATLGGSPSEVQTIIEGFTLCNGYSSAGGGCCYGTAIDCVIEDCYSTDNGGGAYGTLLSDCMLVGNVANSNGGASCGDCVVAWRCVFMDNVSYGSGGGAYNGTYYESTFARNRAYANGGAGYGSKLVRCDIRGNQASYGGGTYNGAMQCCLYYDNYASSSGGGAYYGTLYSCTLTRNKSASQSAGMYYPTAYNTICWGNKLNSGAVSDSYGSSFYNCCLSGSAGSNPVVANPLFFDPDHDDFRLSMNSPCLDRGNNSYVADAIDIIGNARTQNGTIDIGCYEGPVNVWQIGLVVCGVGSVVSNGCSVFDGGSVSFTAIETGYPFLGFYTNGVFATSEKEFTWENIYSHGTLEAWFKQDYYVDASMPDDSGDGLTWETARKDLSAVVAETSNGANIWVKEGAYMPIASRNKHLTITAVDGSANTVISGGGTTRCANLAGSSGLIDARTNTVLIGFTLKDGAATSGAGAFGGTLQNCVIESNRATDYGGGTYYGVQRDCIYRGNVVSNDAAYAYGGAAYYGTSYKCTYTNNLATGATNTYGGAVFGGVHYDCMISGNKSGTLGGGFCVGTYYRGKVVGNDAYRGGGCGSATVYDSLICNNSARIGGGSYSGSFYGCTIVGNVATNVGGAYSGRVRNSIVWGNVAVVTIDNWYSCTMEYSCSSPQPDGNGNICADPLFVYADKGNYRLTSESPCLDAGYNEFASTLLKDIDLHDRILGTAVDMGCYEGAFSVVAETQSTPAPVPHDWLDAYPEILATFGLDYEAMANAQSPGTNGGGKVWPDGSTYYVWQDFVAGTNPTNENSVFMARIEIVNGEPVITWEPDTPELRATRVYRTFGKKTLMDTDWVDITDKDQSEYHFFRVTVDLP